MAGKDYDNTNRFSFWEADNGPLGFRGTININGTDYSCKMGRLAKESAKAFLLVEDQDKDWAPVAVGWLYESKFEMFLAGKMTHQGMEYYVNVYKNDNRKSDKSPVFSGKIKPVDENATPTKSRATKQEETDEDW